VGSPAFKAGVRGDPSQAGSIPVHLRHLRSPLRRPCALGGERDAQARPRMGLDCPPMKKLLLLVIFGGLLALAAKKVRSV
jgi:hypothetical protein